MWGCGPLLKSGIRPPVFTILFLKSIPWSPSYCMGKYHPVVNVSVRLVEFDSISILCFFLYNLLFFIDFLLFVFFFSVDLPFCSFWYKRDMLISKAISLMHSYNYDTLSLNAVKSIVWELICISYKEFNIIIIFLHMVYTLLYYIFGNTNGVLLHYGLLSFLLYYLYILLGYLLCVYI